MAVSKAQQAATKKFEDKNYDKVLLRLRKDKLSKEAVQAAANNAGESLNAYITGAISERMNQEGALTASSENIENAE